MKDVEKISIKEKQMRPKNVSDFLTAFALACVALIACGNPNTGTMSQQEVTDTTTSQQALYGAVSYDDRAAPCSEGVQRFMKDVMFYGRVIARTDAFTQCVTNTIRTNYKPCKGYDIFATDSVATQTNEVLKRTRNLMDVNFRCFNFTDALAKAGDGVLRGATRETIDLGQWFPDRVADSANKPVCGIYHGTFCNEPYSMAWPARQGSLVVWHEAMHNHGYYHADGDGAGCGYKTGDNYNMEVNSMPYIVDGCVNKVLEDSNLWCGNIKEGCGPGALKVWHGGTCQCIADTKAHPPALRDGECYATADCSKNIKLTCSPPPYTDLDYVFEDLQPNDTFREVKRLTPPSYRGSSPTYYDNYEWTDGGKLRTYRVCRENQNGKYCDPQRFHVRIPTYESCYFPRPLPTGACTGFGECDGHTISLWCEKPKPEDANPKYLFEMKQTDGSFREIGWSVYPYYDLGSGLGRIPEVFYTTATLGATYTFRVCRENAYGKTCNAPFDVKNRDEVCPPPPPPPPDHCLKCFKLPSGARVCCDTCVMECKVPSGSTPETP
jgi:hypothetical protein